MSAPDALNKQQFNITAAMPSKQLTHADIDLANRQTWARLNNEDYHAEQAKSTRGAWIGAQSVGPDRGSASRGPRSDPSYKRP